MTRSCQAEWKKSVINRGGRICESPDPGKGRASLSAGERPVYLEIMEGEGNRAE